MNYFILGAGNLSSCVSGLRIIAIDVMYDAVDL